MGFDEEQTLFELDKYEKNPFVYISKHDELPIVLSDVENVHVYGFSISEVDEDYLEWIEKHTPQDCKWEFSWYSEEDIERIERFVLDHWTLKDRYSLMQLQEISSEEIRRDS